MEKSTIDNPIALTFKNRKYNVNKAGNRSGLYVDLDIARALKEERDLLIVILNEAESIISVLMQYGNIRPIEGVIYPEGTHRQILDKALNWLYLNKNGKAKELLTTIKK